MDADKQVMLDLLRYGAYRKLDVPITLSCGRQSYEYINAKQVLFSGLGLHIFSNWVLQIMIEHDIRTVGGPSFPAAIVAGAILKADMIVERTIAQAFVVRNEKKDHGTQKLLEGPGFTEGERSILVEDVVTTGQSVYRAACHAEMNGARVVAICALVDREEGGVEWLQERGVKVYTYCTLSEIRSVADGPTYS